MKVERNIKLLAWFNFFTDFKLYSAIAIIYFSQVTNSLALGMSIFSIANIADAIFEVPTGILSDMVGRKNTIILGALASVGYSLLYAIGGSYFFLALGAVFQGLSVAFYSGNNDALLHDTLHEVGKENEYHNYLGKLSSLFQAALGIGALIGSILASKSFAVVMWLSVISQVICLIISLQIKEPTAYTKRSANIYSHMKDAIELFINNKKIRLVSIASMMGSALGEAVFQFQATFYQLLWPLWAIGFAKAFSYFAGTVSFFYSGKIIDKFKEIKTILIGNIGTRIINIIAVTFPSVISPVLMSSTSIFFGASFTAKNSLLQKEFTPHQRATIASLNSFGESILMALFAYVFGLIGDYLGPAKTILIAQILALIATYLYWEIYRIEKTQLIYN